MRKIFSGIVYYLLLSFVIFSIHIFAVNGNWKIANFYTLIAGALVVVGGCILGIIHSKTGKKVLIALFVVGLALVALAIININMIGTEFMQAYIETGSGIFYMLFSKIISMEEFPFSFIWMDYYTWNTFSLIYLALFLWVYSIVQWKKLF